MPPALLSLIHRARSAACGLLAVAALAGSALLPGDALAAGGKAFDHLTTGFKLTGQHEIARCEDCHVRGIFKGTPKQCAACHTPGTLVTAVIIPNNHIPVSQPCDTCHTTATFYGAHFAHSDVAIGTCGTCHNGVFAKGKTPNHLATSASCDVCHTTVSFGTAFLALPGGHMPTTQACSLCHSNGFTPTSTVMNHAGTAGTCTQCHAPSAQPYTFTIQGSVTIGGKTVNLTSTGAPVIEQPMSQGGINLTNLGPAVNHIPASAACDQCHTNGIFTVGSAFKNGLMKHAAVTGESCASCHNNATAFVGLQPYQIPGAVGTPGTANHIPVGSLDCGNSGCHSASDTNTGTGAGFVTGVVPALSAAGHSAVNLPCASCHAIGMAWKGVSALVTPASNHIPPDNLASPAVACASCHVATSVGTGGFKIASSPVMSVAMHTAVASAVPACTTCHESNSGNLGYQGVLTSIYLRPNTGTSGLSKGTGLDPSHSVGNAATQDCSNCHSTAPPFTSVVQPANHIKLISPTPACADCHTAGYAPGSSTMKHSDVSGTCASCHNTATVFAGSAQGINGQPWQMNGAVGLAGTSTTHFALGSASDCNSSGCHSVSDVMSNNGGKFALSAVPQLSSSGHTTVNLACQTCHTVGMNWKGVATMVTPASNHIPPDNLSSGTVACASCHTATSFGSGGFKITSSPLMTVAMHTAVATAVSACTTCHESNSGNLGYQGVLANIYLRPNTATSGLSKGTGLDPSHSVGNAATQDCSSCHSTAPPFTSVSMPSNHIKLISPTPACADCHAAGYAPGTSIMKHADASGTCASCHNTATVFAGSAQGINGQPWQMNGAVGLAGTSTTHFALGSASDCNSSGCHSVTDVMSNNGGKFALSAVPQLSSSGHTTVNLACATCHAVGMSWKGVATMVGATSAHIPPDNTASPSIACSSCHSATSFGAGGFKISSSPVMSVAMHTTVASAVPACDTCHESADITPATLQFQGVTNNIFLRPNKGTNSGRSLAVDAAHGSGNALSNDCGGCHSTAPPFQGGTLPTNHIKLNPASASACADCHSAGYSPTTTVMKHADVNTYTCASCHNVSTTFSGTAQGAGGGQPWQMNGAVGTAGGTSTTHFPLGSAADCNSSGCHAATDTESTTGAGFYISNTNPVLSSTGHTTVNAACATCHAVGMSWKGVATLVGATSAHIAPDNTASPSIACSSCHSATSFGAGGFKISSSPVMSVAMHTTVASAVPACTTCHEGVAANLGFQGVNGSIYLRPDKGTNSGLSNGADTAHAAPTNAAAGTNDCGGCHSTAPPFTSTTIPAGHITIATGATCATCHTTNQTSVVLPMPHTVVTGTCKSCHETGTKFAGSTFTPNATGSGGTFGTDTGTNFLPRQIVASPAVGVSGGHILPPSADDCSVCHTSTAAFGPGTAMVHTNISSGCASCHSAGAKWYGVTNTASPLQTTGGKVLSPLHVAINQGGNVACEECHANNVFTSFGTATVVNHTSGAFMTYTRGNGNSGSGTSTPKCVTCHAPSGTKWYGVSLSTATMGSHQGSASTADCIDCHSATGGSFGGAAAAAAVAHRPVVRTSGPSLRPGMPATLPGTPFTHLGVAPNGCASCHSAAGGATPQPSGHLPTQLSCDACHRTSAWLPALFTHNGVVVGSCASCHTGNWATAKPANHLLTSRSCDTCHRSTQAWAPQTYTHVDTIYTAHPASVLCSACHTTNTEQVVWKYPSLKPGCAGCHGPQFGATSVRRSKGPAVIPQRVP